jgi:2-iminobutanoate/2-iminopropanoate deaminase
MNIVPLPPGQVPHAPAVYSQAVRAGNFIFVAGQAGVDLNSGKIAEAFETQARQAFENLSLVLSACGSSLQNVVKTTIWLRDAANFIELNELYAEYFPKNAPARSTPIVDLPKPNMQISIEAIAVIGD